MNSTGKNNNMDTSILSCLIMIIITAIVFVAIGIFLTSILGVENLTIVIFIEITLFIVFVLIANKIINNNDISKIKKHIVPNAMPLVNNDNASNVSILCDEGVKHNWGNLHSFLDVKENYHEYNRRVAPERRLYEGHYKGSLAAYDEGVRIKKQISSEKYDEKFIPSDRVNIRISHNSWGSSVSLYSGVEKIDEFVVDREYDKNLTFFAEWYAWVIENKQVSQYDSERYENFRRSLNLLLKEFKVFSYPFDLNSISMGDYLTNDNENIILGRQISNNSLLLYKTKGFSKPAEILIAEYKNIISYEIKGTLEFTTHTTPGYEKKGEWKGTRLAAGYLLAGPVGAALIGKSKDSYIRGVSIETSSDNRSVLLKVKPARDYNSMGRIALEREGNSADLHSGLESEPNLFYNAELFWKPEESESEEPIKDETVKTLPLPFFCLEMLQTLYPEKEKKPGDGLYIQL